MANPRVLAITVDESGCTFYRVWMPFAYLKAKGWQAGWIHIDELREEHIQQADIVVVPRLGGTIPRLERFLKDVRKSGARLVYEVDDDLWGSTPDNPSHESLLQVREGMQYLLTHCDAVTVTNNYLAQRVKAVAGWNIPTFVLPNHIDRRVWDQVRKDKTSRKINALTVGVHGGNSHRKDWEVLSKAWPLVAKQHPEVQFIAAGYCPPELDQAMHDYPDRCIFLPSSPIDRYPHLVRQIDIACCPLLDTPFNRAKSAIKFYESAMAGAAAVCSQVVYGGEAEGDGRHLISTMDPELWAHVIGLYIQNQKLRTNLADDGRRWVLEYREISRGGRLWENAYQRIMKL